MLLIYRDIRPAGPREILQILDTRHVHSPVDRKRFPRYPLDMYLRMTQRRNRDGSTVAYYALSENAWNAAAKRAEARVVHNFGRADQLDRSALQRLVNSINRVPNDGESVTGTTSDLPAIESDLPAIEIEHVFELGVVLAARGLWEDLGIGPAIRRCIAEGGLTAPHEAALFAMAANRLDTPGSKLACAERWLPDVAFLPDAAGLGVDQLYRALDFLAVWSDRIEHEVFLHAADLFRLDVDLIFYDSTTAYFENRRSRRAARGMGRAAVRAAAPARPQQGGPRQPAAILILIDAFSHPDCRATGRSRAAGAAARRPILAPRPRPPAGY